MVAAVSEQTRPTFWRSITWMTVAKFFVNMGLRLAYPFNSDIASGLHVSLDSVGTAQGFGELSGLATLLVGPQLDRGHHRRWMTVGVALGGLGAIAIGIFGNLWWFGICFALIATGTAVMTTAAQTWIGETVPYQERGRVIGVYEASWALALLLGAPLAGLLIARWSWWSPFIIVGAFTLVCLPMLRRVVPKREDSNRAKRGSSPKIAWNVKVIGAIVVSQAMALSATVIFSTYGAWLKKSHGFSIATLSTLTVGLGVMELIGSGSVAAFSDRIGKRRSVAGGATLMAGAAVLLMQSRSVTALAALGIVVFFGAFEFAVVSQISINSEVGGPARGRVMAINGALLTGARAIGAALGTRLYVHVGFTAVTVVSTLCAVVAVAVTVAMID